MAYIFFGIAGEAELILGIWGAKAKYLQGAEAFSGIWEDKCIIVRQQGYTRGHQLLRNKPSKHRNSDYYRPASEMPSYLHFAGGLIVA